MAREEFKAGRKDFSRERSPTVWLPDWDALPDDCLHTVLERLDVRSLVSARVACSRVNTLADQPSLWR